MVKRNRKKRNSRLIMVGQCCNHRAARQKVQRIHLKSKIFKVMFQDSQKKANNQTQTQSASKITFENDLQLALYRHWSVTESTRNSMYCACLLKLWTLKGEKKPLELLVE